VGENTPRPALHRELKAAVYKAIKSGEPTLIAFINGATTHGYERGRWVMKKAETEANSRS